MSFDLFATNSVDPAANVKLDRARHGSTIRLGARGAEVTQIQNDLNAWRKKQGLAAISVNGEYGAETVEAVKQFQRSMFLNRKGDALKQGEAGNEMLVDGIVGFRTMRALDRESNRSSVLISSTEFESLIERGEKARKSASTYPSSFFFPKIDWAANVREAVQTAAMENGIRVKLFETLIGAESGFNPLARSPKGAMGLAQLMPGTARELNVTNPYDPLENARAGAKYLRMMLDRYNGDERLALAAYNAGPGAVDKHGGVPPFKETREYVQKILNAAAV